MWWLWPHLRRLWAGVGTVAAGLIVTWLYSLLSAQALPHVSIASTLLRDYWPWLAGGLLAFATVSFVAEQGHRRHQSRAPQPLRVAPRPWFRRFHSRAPIELVATATLTIVGRVNELAKLNDWFAQVRSGTRRVIFVSGEPGIGKTTLTRTFLNSLAGDRGVRIGRGQCVEQYGAGEPYMPILEALTRFCRAPGGEKLVEILHRMAPAWLAQMPSLISAEDRIRLQSLAQGTTQQRMLREMAEALEVIAAEAPLILYLEDLHWSDPSTLDLIATVARRNESARLMVLGTYRPVEMLAGDHALRAMKEELELHQQAIELRLPMLSEADIAAYLAQRFSAKDGGLSPHPFRLGERDLGQVASAIYARSEGNPLFMVNVVDYLVEQGSIVDIDKIEAPRNIRQMIERNLQPLSDDDQIILEAASVAGAEFSAPAVAAALEQPLAQIEARCTPLARREQFISIQGLATWPDGTRGTTYRFSHALYQEVLYERTPLGTRDEFHRRIAEREEVAYGDHATEIAAELAHHYRQANNPKRSIHFFQLAAEQAAERSALSEAETELRQAIGLVQHLPESAERDLIELRLQTTLGAVLTGRSYGAREKDEVLQRAYELCDRVADPGAVLSALFHIIQFHISRMHLNEARKLAERATNLVHANDDPLHAIGAWHNMGETLWYVGEPLSARTYADRALGLYEGIPQSALIASFGMDFWIVTAASVGSTRLILGSADQALDWGMRIPDRVRNSVHPLTKATGLVAPGFATFCFGDLDRFRRFMASARQLAEEYGFSEILGWCLQFDAYARFWQGERAEGLEQMIDANRRLEAVGSLFTSTWRFATLAEMYLELGDYRAAEETISGTIKLVNRTNERFCEPEIHRVAGEIISRKAGGDVVAAEERFREAIKVAQKQSAKWWELRATTSLARLLRDTNRREEARTTLGEIYGWFREGFDTRVLKDAKALLDELNRRAS